MAAPVDFAGLISFQVGGGDDLGFERQHFGSGKNDAIELKLQPSLAHEVARILGFLKVAAQHRAAWKQGMSERRNRAEVAQDGIAGLRSFGREVRFVQRAVQQRAGWYDDIFSASHYLPG